MDYFRVLRVLQKGDKGLFNVSVESQKNYLHFLGDPVDDIDRSYKQYQCQNFFVRKKKKVMLNLASFFGLPLFMLFLLVKRLWLKKKKRVEAIFESKDMWEIIPAELSSTYSIVGDCWDITPTLSIRDLSFCWMIYKEAPFQCYFTIKSLMNVARYSSLVYTYSPTIIIRHSEYSFSSSLLTAYCHRQSVKHINVMHGEKLYFIRDAYFHFDECYVWAKFYADLFRSMKAESTQFRIAIPPSMMIDVNRYQKQSVFAHYKYYLALYTEDQIIKIVDSMRFAEQQGKTIKYRPHPRYSNMDILRKHVAEKDIEYPSAVSIMESVSNVEFAVGSYTTVLSQAWFSGKKVVLDDVTFKEQYDQLKERGYFLSEMECDKLSFFQE